MSDLREVFTVNQRNNNVNRRSVERENEEEKQFI